MNLTQFTLDRMVCTLSHRSTFQNVFPQEFNAEDLAFNKILNQLVPLLEKLLYEDASIPSSYFKRYQEPVPTDDVLLKPVTMGDILEELVTMDSVLEEPVTMGDIFEEPVTMGDIFEEPVTMGDILEEPVTMGDILEEPVTMSYLESINGRRMIILLNFGWC
uniref:Uncharacterized protein n=1 Tax=Biomphalaria glabrata TaxID=6526 RepID=A0A2C9LPN0_BIOGL